MLSFECPVSGSNEGNYLLQASGCNGPYLWVVDGVPLEGQSNEERYFFDFGEHSIQVSCADETINCNVIILDPDLADESFCVQSAWSDPCLCEGSQLRWMRNITVGFAPSFDYRDEAIIGIEEVLKYTKCLKVQYIDEYWKADIVFGNNELDPQTLAIATTYSSSPSTIDQSIVNFNSLVNFNTQLAVETAAHEFIHAIGVNAHSTSINDIMFDSAGGTSFYDPVTNTWNNLGPWDQSRLSERYCDGVMTMIEQQLAVNRSAFGLSCGGCIHNPPQWSPE